MSRNLFGLAWFSFFLFFFVIVIGVTKLECIIVLQPCCSLQGRLFDVSKAAKLLCSHMKKYQQTKVKIGWQTISLGNKVKEIQQMKDLTTSVIPEEINVTFLT